MKTTGYKGITILALIAASPLAHAQKFQGTINTAAYNSKEAKNVSELNFKVGNVNVQTFGQYSTLETTYSCDVKVTSTYNADLYGELPVVSDYSMQGADKSSCEAATWHTLHRSAKVSNLQKETNPKWNTLSQLQPNQLECLNKQLEAAKPVISKAENKRFLSDLKVDTLKLLVSDNTESAYKDSELTYGASVTDDPIFMLSAVLNSKGECSFASSVQLEKQFALWRKGFEKKLTNEAIENAKSLASTISGAKSKAGAIDGDKSEPKVIAATDSASPSSKPDYAGKKKAN